MAILRSRNGKLLRNSNGILASTCGTAYSCVCSYLSGDKSPCFDTHKTPNKYELNWSGTKYCLDYVDSSPSKWRYISGDMTIELDLEYASETARITVVIDSVTVFSGTKTGTSCVHRIEGTMANTVSPSDWGSVNYYFDCTSAFACSCSLLSGTNCSCYGNNATPSKYIVDFGNDAQGNDIKFCLEYVSDCTWQKVSGSLTITLNLTYATNTTRLTVVDGSTTVFSGDLVNAVCSARSFGQIVNTIENSDWGIFTEDEPDFGYAVFLNQCGTACLNRLVLVEYTGFTGYIAEAYFGDGDYACLEVPDLSVFGYLETSGLSCLMSSPMDVYTEVPICGGGTSVVLYPHVYITYNPTTHEWQVGVIVGGNLSAFKKIVTKNEEEIGFGEELVFTTDGTTVFGVADSACCEDVLFMTPFTGSAVNIGSVKVTVY